MSDGDKPPRIGVAETTRASAKPSKNHVLVVDDDELHREMLKGVLEDRGFVVSAFADAASVLATLQSGIEPRLALLGWSLRGASGLDLLRALRERGCRAPVVFLTGRFLVERKEGAEDLVNKTVAIDTLMQRLERLLA